MNDDPTSLERLHDIVVPNAVPWWPPAPGWYWVFGFVLLVVVVLALRTFIHWQQNRYRREALRELEHLRPTLEEAAHRPAALLALAELLKRTALTAYPREDVATLTGSGWFRFLDTACPHTHFSNGLGAQLERSLYHPSTATTFDESMLDELVTMTRHWIRHHSPDLHRAQDKNSKFSTPAVGSVDSRTIRQGT